MVRKAVLYHMCVFGTFLCQTSSLEGRTLDVVVDFGADKTGATYATTNIQNAIDACNAGDTLLIPPGTYLLNSGLTLKSDLTLNLAPNALLQANTNGIWLKNRSHILYGRGLHNVTIEGGGGIDGGGLVYKRNKGVQPGRGIQIVESTNVTLRNVKVSNIPTFGVDFQKSENLTIDSVTIRGRGFDNLLGSSDGMDIEGCVHVRISNCNIEVGDDALCLKTSVVGFPCHDIRMRDCTLASTCNGFKIGTGTLADVYDVVAENITINKHSNPGNGNPVPSGDCIAAICIESNDHHRIHDITCRNFTINSCYSPIFIELQNRQSYAKGDMGQLDNILIENVNCLSSIQPIIFNWQSDGANKMTNVTLSNVTIHNYGTQTGDNLTCMTGGYPDANKNGMANAYGIWARGVVGLKLKWLDFHNSGARRAKFVFDPSVENVDSSVMNDSPPDFLPRFAQATDAVAAQKTEAGKKRTPGIIRTPAIAATPRINGPGIFGVRPNRPFFYHIPVTGARPISVSVSDLPEGLVFDPDTGNITGKLAKAGKYQVTLHAKNGLGVSDKKFTIVVGESIALTPAMGWNSWNHYADRISHEIVLENAKAMVNSGLIDHGWSYINIDDGWQGGRGGQFFGLQGNNKFPDIKGLCDQIHAMGLKFGLYSTPWQTSYAWYHGGSSDNPEGTWRPLRKIGQYHFATNDASQWAAWGVDYLKYDWNPIEFPETLEMSEALRHSGRDILFSLSNHLKITNTPAISKIANSWRTTGDIMANWNRMSELGFGQDAWHDYTGSGHWSDPDMLEIATAEPKQPGLTPDEEYTHMTLWCLLSAPLLIANDLSHMDVFTKNLLENDEVIAVDQDTLGDQAVEVARNGDARVYAKNMADGTKAIGLFNTGTNATLTVTVEWSDLKIKASQSVRDLWRQRDLGDFKTEFSMPVASHSGELVKIENTK